MRHHLLMHAPASLYHRHRFHAEIISHCVWLYFRFSLSFRDVEELMSSRGVSLTYETKLEGAADPFFWARFALTRDPN
jgi:transposase-like protein